MTNNIYGGYITCKNTNTFLLFVLFSSENLFTSFTPLFINFTFASFDTNPIVFTVSLSEAIGSEIGEITSFDLSIFSEEASIYDINFLDIN